MCTGKSKDITVGKECRSCIDHALIIKRIFENLLCRISLSFFFLFLFCHLVKATERVRQILTEMKTGALLLFIDNTYCEWRKVFREAGYKKTHNILLIDADIDVGDLKTEELESEAFQKLRAMINNYPLLRANNSKNVMMLIEKK